MRFACFARLIVLGVAVLAGCASTRNVAEPQSLDGSAWVLSSLPGRDAVPGVVITAQFESDRVSGSDGCNQYSMPFTVNGSRITIGPMGPSTMMACPESTMAQAAAFITSLQSASSFRRDAKTLQLMNPGGEVVATLARQTQLLAGTSWDVTMINNGRQALVGIVEGSTVTMAFGTDGQVSGTTGCNRYTAVYGSEGDTLRVSSVAATRRACQDEALTEQEQAFLRALESVATLSFEGDRLELRGADGALAVIIVRKQ